MGVTKHCEYIGLGALDVAKHFEFIGLGAMDGPKPYEFMGFGTMDVTTPCEFIRFGAMDVTKPCEFAGLANRTSSPSLPTPRKNRPSSLGPPDLEHGLTHAGGQPSSRA